MHRVYAQMFLVYLSEHVLAQGDLFEVSQFSDARSLEMCRADMLEIDENMDMRLDRQEYAALLQLRTGNIMSGDFELLPIRLESIYFSAACWCYVVDPDNNECCLNGNDHIPLDTTLSFLIEPYLQFLCHTIQEGLLSEGLAAGTASPTAAPSLGRQTSRPTMGPTKFLIDTATSIPDLPPSPDPLSIPTLDATQQPTPRRSASSDTPTFLPTAQPTNLNFATTKPTHNPSKKPSGFPSGAPSGASTMEAPALIPPPSRFPTRNSGHPPSNMPSCCPTKTSNLTPSENPSEVASDAPSLMPSKGPSLFSPFLSSTSPSVSPSSVPSWHPSTGPTERPSPTRPPEPFDNVSSFPTTKVTLGPSLHHDAPQETSEPTQMQLLTPTQVDAPMHVSTGEPVNETLASPVPADLPVSVTPSTVTSTPPPLPPPEPMHPTSGTLCVEFQYVVRNQVGLDSEEIFNEESNNVLHGLRAATRNITIDILNGTYPTRRSLVVISGNLPIQSTFAKVRQGSKYMYRQKQEGALAVEVGFDWGHDPLAPHLDQTLPENSAVSVSKLPHKQEMQRRHLAYYTDDVPVIISSVTDNPLCAGSAQNPQIVCAIVSSTVCVLLEQGDDADVVRALIISGLRQAVDSGDFLGRIPVEDLAMST